MLQEFRNQNSEEEAEMWKQKFLKKEKENQDLNKSLVEKNEKIAGHTETLEKMRTTISMMRNSLSTTMEEGKEKTVTIGKLME